MTLDPFESENDIFLHSPACANHVRLTQDTKCLHVLGYMAGQPGRAKEELKVRGFPIPDGKGFRRLSRESTPAPWVRSAQSAGDSGSHGQTEKVTDKRSARPRESINLERW